jgi:hypothetical protein
LPTWLIILICLPVALWLAYCLLRWSWGLPACLHCMLSWAAAPLLLGVWLTWHGWSQQLERPLVIGATILVCSFIIGGIIFLVFRFGGRSKEARRADATDTAVLGTMAVAPYVGSGSKSRRDGDEATPNDGGLDGDAGGMDV